MLKKPCIGGCLAVGEGDVPRPSIPGSNLTDCPLGRNLTRRSRFPASDKPRLYDRPLHFNSNILSISCDFNLYIVGAYVSLCYPVVTCHQLTVKPRKVHERAVAEEGGMTS